MATFDTLASSTEQSRPAELIELALGSAMYYYSTAEDPITSAGNIYLPVAAERGSVVEGTDQSDQPITIVVPASNDFAARYINVVPAERASATIFRIERDETPTPTRVLVFKGLVHAVEFSRNGREAQIACMSIQAAARRTIPRFTFQAQCNHQLYDLGCKVNPTSHHHSGIVTAVSGSTVTVSGLSASGKDCKGGYCRPTGISDFRMVLSQSGDVLTLLLPFSASPLGLTLECFQGCDHNMTGHCATRFDNVLEFGGHAFVPTKNPFATGLD